MKPSAFFPKTGLLFTLGTAVAFAADKPKESAIDLADFQDELAADIQDLVAEQTQENVIKLLNEVETLMGEAIDELESENTSGAVIAIETHVIEKIFEAAQKRAQNSADQKKKEEQEKKDGDDQQQGGQKPKPGDGQPGQGQGQGQSSGGTNEAMLEMLRQMMGKDGEPQPGKKGEKDGKGESSKGEGGNRKEDSDKEGEGNGGPSTGGEDQQLTERRVPKNSGLEELGLPPEFQQALDAYLRAPGTR